MTTRRTVGVLLLAIGGIAAVIYVLGLIDPVGTKMSDDGDPFGTPTSWQHGAIGLVVSLAVASIGGWLTYFGRPTRPNLPGSGRS